MDGDSCGDVRWSLPIVHRALSPDVVTVFCCCPFMEDACGSMEMMPTNSMQLLLRIACILCHALHIHYVMPAWRMLLAVWWWGLSIVCQPLFADGGGCCLQYGDEAFR
jgi:hypothetical protein